MKDLRIRFVFWKDDPKRDIKEGCSSKINLKTIAMVQVTTKEDLNEPRHCQGKYSGN